MDETRTGFLIGKEGTAYLGLNDLVELTLLRINELRNRRKFTHHRAINVDERIILHLADQVEIFAQMADDVRTDAVYDRLAEVADHNERRALAAEMELEDMYQLLELRGLKNRREWRRYLACALSSPSDTTEKKPGK